MGCSEPHGTVVKLQYCSEDSAHNLNSILGSSRWLKIDSAFHPFEVCKLSTVHSSLERQCVQDILKIAITWM